MVAQEHVTHVCGGKPVLFEQIIIKYKYHEYTGINIVHFDHVLPPLF